MKNKRAAMEMSVGTIVTIILLMSVLVLGLFLTQRIFGSATNAVDSVDNQIQSEIQKVFASEEKKVAFYPTSRDVIIKKGDTPKGFVFAVKNYDVEEQIFSYKVTANDASKCGSTLDLTDAQRMLLGGTGQLKIGPGDISEGTIVKFVVPESAPPCTIEYVLEVTEGDTAYSQLNFFLIIK